MFSKPVSLDDIVTETDDEKKVVHADTAEQTPESENPPTEAEIHQSDYNKIKSEFMEIVQEQHRLQLELDNHKTAMMKLAGKVNNF